jgi:lipopolysaccharide export system protein LptC
MNSFFDKVKQTASGAADAVKDNVQEAKIKNEIVRTYEELGRKTFELVEDGKLKSTALSKHVKHLRELNAQLTEVMQPDWAKDKDKKSTSS